MKRPRVTQSGHATTAQIWRQVLAISGRAYIILIGFSLVRRRVRHLNVSLGDVFPLRCRLG